MTIALIILAIAAGFYVAWNIGANDVANAVGTSVGSGALTLKQAVIIAAIFEFAGAFFLGGSVSETVESGIVKPELFSGEMMGYVYGMLASLLAAGVWIQIASYFGLPVSTTHSIIGAVIGFGLVWGGVDGIYWGQIGSIAISWLISPLLGGVVAYLIFSHIRRRILYKRNPVLAAKRLTPYLVFVVFCSLTLIIMFDGLKNLNLHLNLWEVILLHPFARVRQMDILKGLNDTGIRLLSVDSKVSPCDLYKLISDRIDRIESRHRVLEDHRKMTPSNFAHLCLREIE